MPFQDSTNLNTRSKYIVDANGDTPYTTIQSAIDAANTAAVDATVYIRAGTYAEDLTLYAGINLTGDSGTFGSSGTGTIEALDPSVVVDGSLTLDTSAIPTNTYNTITNIEFSPPTGNVIIWLSSALAESVITFKNSRITVEQAAQAAFSLDGFPTIVLQNCEVWQDSVNADLLEFPGVDQFLTLVATGCSFETNSVVANALPLNTFVHFHLSDCFYQSMIDVSAVATATFDFEANNCAFNWAGLANEPLINFGTNEGSLSISNSHYENGSGPFSSWAGGASTEFLIKNTLFTNTYVTNANCNEDIYDSVFFTGANQALTMSSAQDVSLNNCTINSSNVAVIGGAGAGNLTIGSITFLDGSTIAGTVNKSYATRLETGELKIDDADTGILIATAGVVSTGGGSVNLDNILYVGKHGNDANNGLTPNNAKLTIQAAVTAAAAGDGIIVYPGTYTETITHAANNVTLRAQGKPGTCIITQADANVIDINTRSGIFYDGFLITCTAATTALNTIQVSTGSATFRFCRLRMISASAIVAAGQPSIGAVTGAGTLIVAFGRHIYAHTGACGGTAQKGAFKVANGATIDLTRIEEFDITNSGTALATAVGIDLATTGTFKISDCRIDITDPDATNVVGLAYIGGTGITHEFFRNTLHVIATNNTGYGFYSDDTATTSRFFYNHIHVEDAAGTSNSFLVGNTATVISQFDDIIADDGVSVTAGGTFTCVSSEIDGDLTCRGREATGVVQASVMNMDNTAAAGNAAVNISVGGTTSTGDPYTQWLITGSTAFSAGIDNSDVDAFKIGPNVDPSTGNSDFEIAAATGAITFNEAYEFPVADGTANYPLITDGAGNLDFTLLPVAGGGTGAATFTDHGVLVGSGAGAITALAVGTNGQVLIGSTGADPVFGTISNGNNITWTLGAGTLEADLTGTTDHTVQIGNATNSLTSLAAATNGQLIIGSTGADPAVAGLASADASVTITVGAGTIDLSAAGGGLTWSVEAGAAKAAVVNEGYISNRAGGVTYTIPTTAAVGSIIRICSIQGLSTIAQNAAESIVYGAFTTTVGVGGSLVATNVGDTIEILCTVADTTWAVLSSVGNWTVN